MAEAIAGIIFPIFTRFPTAALMGVKEEGVQTPDMGQAETQSLFFLLRFPGGHARRWNCHVKNHCLIKFYCVFHLSSLPAAADLQDIRKKRGERQP